MSKIIDIIGKVFGSNFVESVGTIIDNVVTTKEEKELLKIELTKVIAENERLAKEQTLKEIQLDNENTKDARASNASIQNSDKASWLSKNTPYIIALLLSVLFFAVTTIIIFKMFNIEATKEIDVSTLIAVFTAVVSLYSIPLNFFFGSSSSSQQKDLTISRLSK